MIYNPEFGDMMEFDEFEELVDWVRDFHHQAAELLEEGDFKEFKYSGRLSNCFNWDETPEGFEFWQFIDDTLAEMEV